MGHGTQRRHLPCASASSGGTSWQSLSTSVSRRAVSNSSRRLTNNCIASATTRRHTPSGRSPKSTSIVMTAIAGLTLNRPGLDRLRDRAAMAAFECILITAPDRLARNYVHQMLLVDELTQRGCRVEFSERPMSNDPHDQLLLQIRSAVAEYERTLIAERMLRGRQAKLRS